MGASRGLGAPPAVSRQVRQVRVLPVANHLLHPALAPELKAIYLRHLYPPAQFLFALSKSAGWPTLSMVPFVVGASDSRKNRTLEVFPESPQTVLKGLPLIPNI
jgi:hypothetical protein